MPTLGGVDGVVGIVCSSAVLVDVLVAMDVAVLVHGLHPTYGSASLVAVDVAVTGAVLMAVVVCFRHTSLLSVVQTYTLG